MKQSSPRWMVELTAWAAALVLVAGVGVLVTGVISTTPKVAATTASGQTPVLTLPSPTASPRPTVTRKPVVKHVTTPKPVKTRNENTYVAPPALGPPPGPFNDLVPAHFAAPENRYAFLYGITHYKAPTEDTVAGAQDNVFIRSELIADGWLPQNIRIVTDYAATGDALRSGLAWLASKSTPTTFTLFHYSGHVKQRDGHEYLWPNDSDRDFVEDDLVTSLLNKGTGRMWVDIAGCESGGFIAGLASPRVLVTTSSETHEKSYEYPQWGESVYAGLVWDIGLQQGKADANHNGITTVGEALRYAVYYAHAITIGQVPYGPQIPQVAGDDVLGWTLSSPPSLV